MEAKPAMSKADQWAGRIAAQQRSGMSVKQFCKEQGLTEYSFYAWRKRLQERGPVRFALVERKAREQERTVEAALPWIEKSDAGSILVISSVSGLEFDFTSPAYGTFKAALIHYASRMANTLAGKHIRVNTVSPGNTYFEGGIWQKIEQNMPDLFKAALAKNPWGRMATDLEVANAAVFLASPRASFITGVNLVVDGALTNRVQY